MFAFCDAAGHLQVNELVLPRMPADQLIDQVRPFVIGIWIGDTDSLQTALQAGQVIGPAKRLAGISRHHFVNTIAKDEAAIQHRDTGLGQREVFTVQIDGLIGVA